MNNLVRGGGGGGGVFTYYNFKFTVIIEFSICKFKKNVCGDKKRGYGQDPCTPIPPMLRAW